MRDEWQQLLERSDADRLFSSWHWQSLWWEIYGSASGGTPCIFTARSAGKLVGMAPFYRVHARRNRVIPVMSLQLIGHQWRNPDMLISEKLDLIVDRAHAEGVRDAFAKAVLARSDWSELALANVAGDGPSVSQLRTHASRDGGVYVRETDSMASYEADLSSGFDAYVRGLSASSRRSLWLLRRRLEAHGAVTFETVSATQVAATMTELNRLHALRWGGPVFTGRRWEFHIRFATQAAERGELALSRLQVDGRTVSVLYDVRIGERQYNLQMGFDPGFARGISLGLLHLGYAMQSAARSGVKVYDFLAGPGKKSDYKRHLGGAPGRLSTLQFIRGPLLSRLYRGYDQWQAHRRAPPNVST